MAPCFEECDASTALPVGATPTKAHARVALTSMPHSYLTSIDAQSGWTHGGTPVRASLSVAVASEFIVCHFGATRVLARPAGVAVVETVAQAQGENIEIDCISPARPRGAVTVRAALAQSNAPRVDDGVSFLYR